MRKKHVKTAENLSLKDKLTAIIVLESQKDYKEMDSDLVTECVDFLMELDGKERLTKEEIEKRVTEIPFKDKVTALNSYEKKKVRSMRLAIAAAVLAVIITLCGIISICTGDTVSEFFRSLGNSIHEMLDGNPTDDGNITYHKYDDTKIYSSPEEFSKSEGVEILYPSWLPDNEKIVKIRYLSENDTELYLLQCDAPEFSILIDIDTELSKDYILNCAEKEIAGYLVYYEKTPELVQGNFMYKNNSYRVKADTEDNLFKIIESLKEIN